ncbi:carboxypeptidase-like regulatory domain-containing protein [Tenacibaculum xiamenense]|uniref:carboxypeptidase-like regulatory domain-containing protein n=1 Tax=Tenacibaculum xiamenense TaxID=1261553 RepID=UPI003893E48D
MSIAKKKNILIAFFLFFNGYFLNAQEFNKVLYSFEFKNRPISEILYHLAKTTERKIIFNPSIFKGESFTGKFENSSFSKILSSILKNKNITQYDDKGAIVLTLPKLITVYGYVKNIEDSHPLSYVSMYCEKTKEVFTTDREGYFNIKLPKGKYRFLVQYLGVLSKRIEIDFSVNNQKTIYIDTSVKLNEIVVKNLDKNFTLKNDKHNLKHNDLVQLAFNTPNIGGGSDLFHVTRSIAGIQSGAGGIGGYFVRGSDDDQNLFLLDGVPIYNPYHSLGLSSIFFPKNVASFRIYKSGIPAEYGDRSSAVFDVKTKSASLQKSSFSGEMNTENALFTLESPLEKDKSSIFVSGRFSTFDTYYNDILKNTLFPRSDPTMSKSYFDLTSKLKFQLGKKSELSFMAFLSEDNISASYTTQETIPDGTSNSTPKYYWRNKVYSLQFQHLWSSDLFLKSNLSLNNYYSKNIGLAKRSVDNVLNDFLFRGKDSDNNDIRFSSELNISSSKLFKVKLGGSAIWRTNDIRISELQEKYEEKSEDELLNEGTKFDFSSFKGALYAENTTQMKNWLIQIGARSTIFKSGEKSYFHFQPRLYLGYQISPKIATSFAINNNRQYLHVISSTNLTLPDNLWIPSNKHLKPENTWHANVDVNFKIKKGIYFKNDIFYKHTRNKIFKDPFYFSQDILRDFTQIIQGKGISYGFENSLYINKKKWSMQCSYTYNNSELTFNNINESKPFQFHYNRKHEFKLLGNIKLSPKFSIGYNGYFGSAHPIIRVQNIPEFNLIEGLLLDQTMVNREFNDPQHRIDLSFQYNRKGKRTEHNIKLNLYNIYAKKAPLFLYTDAQVDFTNSQFSEGFALPFIPSISYSIKLF